MCGCFYAYTNLPYIFHFESPTSLMYVNKRIFKSARLQFKSDYSKKSDNDNNNNNSNNNNEIKKQFSSVQLISR